MTDRWSIAWTFRIASIVNFLDAACRRVLCHFCFSSAKNTKQLRPTSQFRYRYRPTTRPARSLTRNNAGFGQTEGCVSAVMTDIAAGAAKTRPLSPAASRSRQRCASPPRSDAMPSHMLHRNLVGVMLSLKGQSATKKNVSGAVAAFAESGRRRLRSSRHVHWPPSLTGPHRTMPP